MPKKYYCDYCDIYLKNSSRITRLEHNNGRNHLAAKIAYYQKVIAETEYKNTIKKLLQFHQERDMMMSMNSINTNNISNSTSTMNSISTMNVLPNQVNYNQHYQQ